MAIPELTVFLVVFTLTAAVGTCWGAFRQQEIDPAWRNLLLVLVLPLVVLAIVAGSLVLPGRNALFFALDVRGFSRPLQLAWATGIASGLLVVLLLSARHQPLARRMAAAGTYLGTVLLFTILVLKDLISPMLGQPTDAGAVGLIQREVAPGFRIEEYARLTISPTSLAVGPEGILYVAGLSGVAFQNGQVLRLDPLDKGIGVREQVVARYLNRPHGIAFHEGDLYISRAGQFNRARDGLIVQENTGLVTRGRDLDGDGVYEHFDDVLEGLPGAHMPDGLHQNNGLCFSPDGWMYVTVGADSDHGPPLHPWGGSILRCRADGTQAEVFARGLRNPFDLCFGPQGQLFCTDNDPDEANPGDKLNHVVQRAHFGFPFDAQAGQVEVEGARAPLLRARSLEGLAYAPIGSLPTGYDDCLYVAAYADNQINRIQFTPKGESFECQMDLFARVNRVLDLVVHDGAIYCCSHDGQLVLRIVPE